MSEYKRWISYLYNYESGIKCTAVGYARIELKNGILKIILHIEAPSLRGQKVKAYLISRAEKNTQALCIGELQMGNGTADVRFVEPSENLAASGKSINLMDGLLLYVSESKFFASLWNDELITQKMVRRMFSETEEAHAPAAPRTEVVPTEVVPTAAAQMEAAPTAVPAKAVPEEVPKSAELAVKAETVTAAVYEASEDQRAIERIFRRCPSIDSCKNSDVESCVRLEPEEIGMLPPEYWCLRMNSFLMHGYYAYSHLALAKKRDGSGYTYCMMVPGMYGSVERGLAKMFGFGQFMPMRNEKPDEGSFGYWFKNINA